MKKLRELLEKRWFANLFVVCAGILFYLLLIHISVVLEFIDSVFTVIGPIIAGMIIAYLIDPVAVFFEKKVFRKLKKEDAKRILSVILSLLVIISAITLFFIILVPSLADSIRSLANTVEMYVKDSDALINQINSIRFLNYSLDITRISTYFEKGFEYIVGYLSENAEALIDTSKSVGNSIFNLVVGFILGVYFLLGKKHLLQNIEDFRMSLLKDKTRKKHDEFFARCHDIFIRYIGCDLLDGFIVGAANALVMLILGMPYVALISLLVGVTNLIPTFGPLIGGLIGAFILVLNKPVYALWFLITLVVIQTVDGYLLKPKLFGGSLGIPAVWTLIAIVTGGKLFGVLGIFLAIPFAAVISFLYKESFLPWLRKNKEKKEDKPGS